MKEQLDQTDIKLVSLMTEDGMQSTGRLAERMGVTAPTIRSRIKNLVHDGLVRIAAMVDPNRVSGVSVALVGLCVQSQNKLDHAMEQISQLNNINWVAVVTGRYDLLVEIVLTDGIDGLYHFINEELSQIGGITNTESFVVMQSRRKWILLPQDARHRDKN
ncbi:Lrp/AsnC family transcriptional regulator [Desulfobaculum bizertense]|uniref:Lrp/AsnC family transcriptional regulator, regulator for asnA, asnC and gidA n=1 Tax=Desulfobaculum bizertense DSM 18034 TaxID=1121442 RepID=A0A1T4WS95_9BACT|nr:Lrp/AsnC family transcriptional regulator [Desulfobaculum bizertense]UIJ37300.1 Lrp/AsnC family transcriptional regulator [Desulfobaculum bizertense]SKA79715.1 Lrp/AsnC family transcriptional regulator, regulator for asnA, asnC and gidA [Desulfobaculum bizertense DSM 18034]